MRRPSSYLIESAWQGNFSYRAIYFCKSRRQTHPESSPPLSKPSKPASNAAADFHINRWRMSPRRRPRSHSVGRCIRCLLFFDFRDVFYAYQTLLEAPSTGAMAFRVFTMHGPTGQAHSNSLMNGWWPDQA
jgi:hypothetical protein